MLVIREPSPRGAAPMPIWRMPMKYLPLLQKGSRYVIQPPYVAVKAYCIKNPEAHFNMLRYGQKLRLLLRLAPATRVLPL